MTPAIFNWVSVIACLCIVFMGVFMAINHMGKGTSHWVRWAWILITTAAFAILVGPLYGRTPSDMAETAMFVGIAIFLGFDRRRHFMPQSGVIKTRTWF